MMTATLVLNASYEPLGVVPVRRAVVMVLSNKAAALEFTALPLRSATLTMDTPDVIRLIKYVRLPHRRSLPFSKKAILARDGFICAYCAKKADSVDHVVPKSLGGGDSFENCVAACRRCNGKKGARTLAQLGWNLPFTPAAPANGAAMIVGSAMNPTWEQYLGGAEQPRPMTKADAIPAR